MGDGGWEMGDGKWEVGNGRWKMGGGKWEMEGIGGRGGVCVFCSTADLQV